MRFRKSAKLGPFRFTFTDKGTSASFGVKGARIGRNRRGTYVSGSLPGTGLYTGPQYLTKKGGRRAPVPRVEEREARTGWLGLPVWAWWLIGFIALIILF